MTRRRATDGADERSRHEDVGREFATQDWLIVFEALVAWAGPPADRARGTTDTPRERRAWELVDLIASGIDLPPDEVPFRIDDDWAGPPDEG